MHLPGPGRLGRRGEPARSGELSSASQLPLETNRPGTSPGLDWRRCAFRSYSVEPAGRPVNPAATPQAQVEMRGLEPLTSALQKQRSPN